MLRHLDRYIDGALKNSVGMPFGPASRLGSAINVVICGLLVASSLVSGITQSPEFFAVAPIGLVLEIFFVRIMVRARRGDFGPF